MATRIHLDTDLGGDPDAACALGHAPRLAGRGVGGHHDNDRCHRLTVRHCLELAGRSDVPLAAGAAVSLATSRVADPVIGDERC